MSESIRSGTNNPKFSQIPDWLLDEASPRAYMCYGALASYANWGTGKAWPGRAALAKRLRCHVKTVDAGIAELESIGAVRVERSNQQTGGTNIYWVFFHKNDVLPVEGGGKSVSHGEGSVLPTGREVEFPRTRTIEPELSNKSITAAPKPTPIKQERTIVSEEWVESIRAEWEPQLVGYWRSFDQIIEWATGREYYDSTKDKQKYVTGRLVAAVRDHKAHPKKPSFSGNQPSSAPAPVAKQNSIYAERDRIKMEKFREARARGIV